MRHLAALILCAIPSLASELELRFTALEHILADQLFTQEGRHYVRGNRTTKCQFAYLESPRIDNDNGKLRIAARFSGRSALDLFGGCVGLGDSFNLTITATPIPRKDAIALSDVKITATKDNYYIRRVRQAMSQSMARDFKLEIRDQARRLLEQAHEGYKQELASFTLTEIRLTPDSLILAIDFRLLVK
ncbi:MAG TPA: hypothetical protein VKR43_23375 [Bryobacteraceae bacterium]|nr:hypothetical protein [Bryobacteraceae bacterium]